MTDSASGRHPDSRPIAPRTEGSTWEEYVPIFDRCINYLEHEGKFVHLVARGISKLEVEPHFLEKLNDYILACNTARGEQRPLADIPAARERAEWATAEKKNGFPTLHAHSAVAICSALDAMVVDLCAAHIRRNPEVLDRDNLCKIRVPIAEFRRLDEDEKADLIVDEVRAGKRAGLRNGVGRFEALLDEFGLGGRVEEEVRRTLFELFQVRNAIVHRGGLTDRRLRDACPWKGLAIGAVVNVSHEDYMRYQTSAIQYVTTLLLRLQALRPGKGEPLPPGGQVPPS